MKIKIVSDGMGIHTEIHNVETGEPLENVVSVSWQVDRHGWAIATIVIKGVPIEAVGTTPDEIKKDLDPYLTPGPVPQ